MKLLDGNYLFQTPSFEPSPAFGLLTAGFVVLFLLCAFAYWRRSKLASANPPLKYRIRSMATTGMWLSAFGIILAILRYAEVPYIGMPVWMYLLLLAMIAAAAYYVYDFSERYPLAVWKLQEASAGRRYRPAVRQRSEPARSRARTGARPANMRGKRRR